MGGDNVIKGLSVLLKAIDTLVERGINNLEIYLYGANYVNINCKANYHICGEYTNQQLQKIMNQLDLVVVPSLCPETFGYVVLESLHAGVPVICSNQVGSKDLLKNAPVSLIYNSENHEELADTICNFMKNSSEVFKWVKTINLGSMSQHVQKLKQVVYQI